MKICFLDRSTKLQTVLDVNKPRGGMITSLFKISDYLSRQGHKITVLSDIQNPGVTKTGVMWVNEYNLESYDFLVLNRGIGNAYPDIKAKHRILWTHDLPHNGFIPEPKNIKPFSVVFMSKYAERIWRTFYKDIGKSFYIPNGVDKSLFKPMDKSDFLIFASAPNRGLKRLPFIYEAINTRYPIDMKAFSNLKVLHPNEAAQKKKEGIKDDFEIDYKSCEEVGIQMHKPISQKRLSQQLAMAKLMILPTDYPEICSNIILQSLACGTPIITTGNLGSAGEWIKHRKNGMLTTFQPQDYMTYQVEMVRNAVEALDNERLYKKLVKGALKTKIHDWDQIGYLWNQMLNRLN